MSIYFNNVSNSNNDITSFYSWFKSKRFESNSNKCWRSYEDCLQGSIIVFDKAILRLIFFSFAPSTSFLSNNIPFVVCTKLKHIIYFMLLKICVKCFDTFILWFNLPQNLINCNWITIAVFFFFLVTSIAVNCHLKILRFKYIFSSCLCQHNSGYIKK